MITAWASLLAALAAIIGLWVQIHRSRLALGVDMLLKMDERFASERMWFRRRAAAQSIKDGTFDEIWYIIDFFETLDLLIKRNAPEVWCQTKLTPCK